MNMPLEDCSIAESDELFNKQLDNVTEFEPKLIEPSFKPTNKTIHKPAENIVYQNGTGELYMRAGVAIFTLCALISHIIHLIQMFEAYFIDKEGIIKCKATFFITVISKVSCVLFILFQSAFIFKYANIVLHSGKNIAILGLMHIICTNFCLFIRTVIAETAAEINHEYSHESLHENIFNHSEMSLDSANKTKLHYEHLKNLGCINISISEISKQIQKTQNRVAEHLYPFVVEFCLLAMTIFYVLWSSFESRYSKKFQKSNCQMKPIEKRRLSIFQNRRGSLFGKNNAIDKTQGSKENTNHSIESNRFTIDCSKSTKGYVEIYL
jgi:hypothetical protein